MFAHVSATLATTGSVILFIYGIGACIFAGLFYVNTTKSIETFPEKIHGIGSGIGFMALLFLPLITGLLCFKSGNMMAGTVSVIIFILGIVFFVLFVMSEKNNLLVLLSVIADSGNDWYWHAFIFRCWLYPLWKYYRFTKISVDVYERYKALYYPFNSLGEKPNFLLNAAEK